MAEQPKATSTSIVLDGTYSLKGTGVIPISARIETRLPVPVAIARIRTAGHKSVSQRGDEVVVKVEHMRGPLIDELLPTLYRLAAD